MRALAQVEKQPGTALVLSGGATKAFYFHLGVLKTLNLHEISSIVGTSAGAVMGAFIASGATPESLVTSLYQKKVYVPKFDKWVKTLTSSMLFKPRYADITRQSLFTSLSSLKFFLTLPILYNKDIIAEGLDQLVHSQSRAAGFFDGVALEELFRSLLPSADFADTEIDLYVPATALDSRIRAVFNGRYNLEDADDQFMTDVPIHQAVRASSAIPGMFAPVKIHGRYYIDGEIKRTLSSDIGVQLADRVIISHTYQPLELKDGRSVRDLGWLNVLKQATSTVFYERMQRWRETYADNYPEKEIIWIEPDPEDVEFFLAPDFSFKKEIQRSMIKSGERAALKALGMAAIAS